MFLKGMVIVFRRNFKRSGAVGLCFSKFSSIHSSIWFSMFAAGRFAELTPFSLHGNRSHANSSFSVLAGRKLEQKPPVLNV